MKKTLHPNTAAAIKAVEGDPNMPVDQVEAFRQEVENAPENHAGYQAMAVTNREILDEANRSLRGIREWIAKENLPRERCFMRVAGYLFALETLDECTEEEMFSSIKSMLRGFRSACKKHQVSPN